MEEIVHGNKNFYIELKLEWIDLSIVHQQYLFQ